MSLLKDYIIAIEGAYDLAVSIGATDDVITLLDLLRNARTELADAMGVSASNRSAE